MAKHQIKFYVDDDEKKRLDTIAKRCSMPTANYVKSTALGVRIRQPKEVFVYVDSDEQKEPITIEKEVIKEVIMPMQLSDTDRSVLQELLDRYNPSTQFFALHKDSNPKIYDAIARVLGNQL